MVEHFRNVSENYEIRIWYRDGGLIFLMFHDVSSSIMAAYRDSIIAYLSDYRINRISVFKRSENRLNIYLYTL